MEEKTSTCSSCGYQWTTGYDGSHSCLTKLQETIQKQKEQLANCETQRDEAIKLVTLSLLEDSADMIKSFCIKAFKRLNKEQGT